MNDERVPRRIETIETETRSRTKDEMKSNCAFEVKMKRDKNILDIDTDYRCKDNFISIFILTF